MVIKIAVSAVGTRGDVQPLLGLAAAVKEALCREDEDTVTLITHAAHQTWVQRAALDAGLQLRLLSSPPARVWQAAPQEGATRVCGNSSGSSEEERREEFISACAASLGLPLPTPGSGGAGQRDGRAASAVPRALLIFNLFALEAFHLAEALAIPCLAASPCLVPYAPPAGFERRFRLAHPRLYERLRAADERRATGSGSTSGSRGSVGWSDVRHWLWPLFIERWGPWRHHRLGLPEAPYLDCPPGVDLPAPPVLLYGISEAVVPRPGYWPPSARLCGFWSAQRWLAGSQQQLPASVLRLLRGDGAAAARPTPAESQHHAAGPGQVSAAQAGLSDAAATAPQAEPALICVDFGSMGLLGLLPRPDLLAAVLQAAARLLGRRMVVLTAGWHPLLEACRQLEQELQQAEQEQQQQQQTEQQQSSRQEQRSPERQPPWLVALEQPVPHALLLPRCAAILHHGGAGTVAAALRCGLPQAVCPLHFDQQQWAERVAWLGCGAQLSPATLLQDGRMESEGMAGAGSAQEVQGPLCQRAVEAASRGLADALQALLEDEGMRRQCAQMRDRLASEDGTAGAVAAVRQQLEQRAVQQARPQEHPLDQAAAAAAGAVPAPQAPPERIDLPGGLSVLCISPGEAAFIHSEVFQQDCYFPAGVSLGPGSVVVDAGANIGLFALRVLRDARLGPAVERLYAFEPLPPTADVLEANLREHGVADKVTVLRCGLHSAPGCLRFTFYPAMPGNSTAAPAEKWEHQRPAMAALMGSAMADACFQGAATFKCPVTTLACFAREQRLRRIDLLKVDVEGSELEVLRGLDPGTWRLVRQVAAEVHDVGDRLAATTKLLEDAGFAVHAERAQAGPAGNWLLFAWQLPPDGDEC